MAKAASDGSAWALFDVVSGQYDMLSQGKYHLLPSNGINC